MLFRAPAFTLAATVVLALGLGATTAVFTLVHSLLLAPLPYPESDRLIWMAAVPPRPAVGLRGLYPADLPEVRSQTHVFEKMSGLFPGSWNITGVGDAQRLSGAGVAVDFFETLRIKP